MAMFILDSNVFIQAHRSTYPLDIFTGFWSRIGALAKQNKICSIDKVKNELDTGDLLDIWCKSNLSSNFFLKSEKVIGNYEIVVKTATVRLPNYNKAALDTFFDTNEADAWLIAHAMNEGAIIVTHEKADPTGYKRVKIPDICDMLGIKTISTVEMLRELNESF